MNGPKMSKIFFFQMIEKRLKDLEEKVEEMKADKEMPFEQRLNRENILFGRISELYAINFEARDVDYWKYSELERKITEVRDRI